MSSKLLPLLTWRSAICDSGLPSTTRHVALTLSLYMSERGDSAHPGTDRMVHDTGLSERAVRAHLSALVEAGWLVVTQRGGLKGARKLANEYRASIPDTPASGAGVSDGVPLSPTPTTGAGGAGVTPAGGAGVPLQEDHLTPAPGAPHLSRISPENYPPNPPTRPAPARVSVVAEAARLASESICAEHRPDRPAAYAVSVSKRLRREHHDLAMALAADGVDPAEIAARIVEADRAADMPDPHPAQAQPSPLDDQAAAALKRMAANAARLADEPAPDQAGALAALRRVRSQLPAEVA